MVLFLCNAWLDSGYMFCSDPEIVSGPALWCVGLRVSLDGEVCAVYASVAFLSWWSHLEIAHYVYEPFVLGSPLFAAQVLPEELPQTEFEAG